MKVGNRTLHPGLLLLVLLLAGGVTAAAVMYGPGRQTVTPAQQWVEVLEQQPLFRAILKNHPEERARLVRAAEDHLRTGSASVQLAPAIASLMQTHVGPALRAADDDSVLALWESHTAMVDLLSLTDVSLCSKYLNGQDIRPALDEGGAALQTEMMVRLERVYVSGRGKPQAADLSEAEIGRLLSAMGMTPADVSRGLNPSATEAESCAYGAKLVAGSAKLDQEGRIAIARAALAP